ncbi:MAG: hypothetical protein ACI4ET_04790 [Bilifractor sp.]
MKKGLGISNKKAHTQKVIGLILFAVIIFTVLMYLDRYFSYVKPGVYCVKGMEDVGPQVYLYPDGTGSFCYASASSDWPDGTYFIKDRKVILVDDYFDRKFVFSIHLSGLVYEQKLSSELPYHDDWTAQDGMLFQYNKAKTDYYLYGIGS